MNIPVNEFKSKCLSLIDEVQSKQKEVIITKHGKPIAKLVPIENKKSRPIFGWMKGSVTVNGNIIEPFHNDWKSNNY